MSVLPVAAAVLFYFSWNGWAALLGKIILVKSPITTPSASVVCTRLSVSLAADLSYYLCRLSATVSSVDFDLIVDKDVSRPCCSRFFFRLLYP